VRDDEIDRKLSAYHDGEVSESERADLEDLIAADAGCSQETLRLKRLSSLLRSAPVPDIPASVRARLHGALEPSPENGLLLLAEFLAAAAVVLLIFGSTLWMRLDRLDDTQAFPGQDWQQTAITAGDELTYTDEPDIQLAQWMVAGLNEAGNGYE
jgi:anti-sigma factor RsiW